MRSLINKQKLKIIKRNTEVSLTNKRKQRNIIVGFNFKWLHNFCQSSECIAPKLFTFSVVHYYVHTKMVFYRRVTDSKLGQKIHKLHIHNINSCLFCVWGLPLYKNFIIAPIYVVRHLKTPKSVKKKLSILIFFLFSNSSTVVSPIKMLASPVGRNKFLGSSWYGGRIKYKKFLKNFFRL